MKDKTTFELVTRLNEIMVEENQMALRSLQLEKEHDEIVYELWNRYPNTKDSPDIQPKKKVRKR